MVNEGGFCLLKILQILFSIIVTVLAGYGLFTKDFQFQAYMTLFLGLTMLVLGLREVKEIRNRLGGYLIGVFVFSIIVATHTVLC